MNNFSFCEPYLKEDYELLEKDKDLQYNGAFNFIPSCCEKTIYLHARDCIDHLVDNV